MTDNQDTLKSRRNRTHSAQSRKRRLSTTQLEQQPEVPAAPVLRQVMGVEPPEPATKAKAESAQPVGRMTADQALQMDEARLANPRGDAKKAPARLTNKEYQDVFQGAAVQGAGPLVQLCRDNKTPVALVRWAALGAAAVLQYILKI